jgi:hypothetical protein
LKNHCQPYSNHGVLCLATLPHGSVPPITRSRIPSQAAYNGYSNLRKMYFILHNKTCGCVWRTPKALPKNSRLSDSELHCPLKLCKLADLCAVRNRQKSAISSSRRCFSHDELLAIFESLSYVTAKLNNSHLAHETNLFLTFTLFYALPRTINLYDFQP